MMSRAISNLLLNALKYNPEGTSVDIELIQIKDEISLNISDNGIGIPESIRDTLFDPFVRGNAARTSDGGTGLGLSIAKKAVELHGGELHLLNTTGRTTFQIKLYKGKS
ncbi:Sensor histidine kinase YycG [compost metagenome]